MPLLLGWLPLLLIRLPSLFNPLPFWLLRISSFVSPPTCLLTWPYFVLDWLTTLLPRFPSLSKEHLSLSIYFNDSLIPASYFIFYSSRSSTILSLTWLTLFILLWLSPFFVHWVWVLLNYVTLCCVDRLLAWLYFCAQFLASWINILLSITWLSAVVSFI